MLQFAAVLTTGGLLLFNHCLQPQQSLFLALANRIIDSKNLLQSEFDFQKFKINYLYDAVLGLIFVIAWRKQIDFDHPKKLLNYMSLQWKNVYQKIVWKNDVIIDAPNFTEPWQKAFQKWMIYNNRKAQQGTVMKKFENTEDGKKISKKKNQQTKSKGAKQNEQQLKNQKGQNGQKVQKSQEQLALQKMTAKDRLLYMQKKKKSPNSRSPKHSPEKHEQSGIQRKWKEGKVSKKDLEKLDFSKKGSDIQKITKSDIYHGLNDQGCSLGFVDSDEEVSEQKESKFLSKWVGKLKNVVGDKKITREDLQEVLKDFKQKLMQKNVAHDVAEQVSEAVGVTLLETKTKSFTTVHKTVRQAMKEALRKILTPKRKIDLVMQVTKQRQKMKPYVIVFIGVNGVGKSTNLAKVAYMLKQAKLSVMLAACDNFRAGAVQQIMTHGRNLDIPVFQKGYKQEPANIAFEAIRDVILGLSQATKKRIDAVLIDTAGRMQDNTPLMKQLGRLVKINKPNLVVFIGQALVGNDAVDQITKFNEALKQEASQAYKSEIDGIILSKFDTVDDKVGTALSLVYSTSKPILFVGIGQKYPNLKQLNVSTVVQALLS